MTPCHPPPHPHIDSSHIWGSFHIQLAHIDYHFGESPPSPPNTSMGESPPPHSLSSCIVDSQLFRRVRFREIDIQRIVV